MTIQEDRAPDPMTTCNSCEWRTADPDSAAGYCTECEREARAATTTEES